MNEVDKKKTDSIENLNYFLISFIALSIKKTIKSI